MYTSVYRITMQKFDYLIVVYSYSMNRSYQFGEFAIIVHADLPNMLNYFV